MIIICNKVSILKNILEEFESLQVPNGKRVRFVISNSLKLI